MLFYLDAGLEIYASRGDVPRSVVLGLDILALGFREGKHIVSASLPTLNALLKVRGLQVQTIEALKVARDKFSQLMSLVGSYNQYVKVVSGNAGVINRLNAGDKTVIEIPIDFFSDSKKIQKTVVLGEHLVDAEIAVLMAKYYCHRNRLSSVPIQPDPRCGGGGSMVAHVAQLAGDEVFTVTIVDSDKVAPNAADGDTLKGVRKVINKHQPPLMELIVLDCREMENALPDDFYSGDFAVNNDRLLAAELLRKLSESNELDIRKHIDIKKGLSRKEIFAMAEGTPEAAFWKSKLGMLKQLSPFTANHDNMCERFDRCEQVMACGCWYLKPHGDKILDFAVTELRRKHCRDVGPGCAQTWERIGRFVFEWCSGWAYYRA
jgi:hypothetical protein